MGLGRFKQRWVELQHYSFHLIKLVSALSCYALTETLILVLLAFLCFTDQLAEVVIGSPTVKMFGLGFLSVDALSGFICFCARFYMWLQDEFGNWKFL